MFGLEFCKYFANTLFFLQFFCNFEGVYEKKMKTKRKYIVSLFLDTRKKKHNQKYPVKLRIYIPQTQKQKFYTTEFDFLEKEFEIVRESNKPPKGYEEDKIKMQALEARANEVANGLSIFSFEKFESEFFSNESKATSSKNINYYYNRLIHQYYENNQIKTAKSYNSSLKSLQKFNDDKQLSFFEVDKQWLQKYQHQMTDKMGKSPATVGLYLRYLRAIFNIAIEEGVISKDLYPFDKRKYKIPQRRGVKKALDQAEIKLLFKRKPYTKHQSEAKDFWFFSYGCHGMNMKDIANLEYGCLKNNTIEFVRAKSTHTATETFKVTIFLNAFTKGVIKRRGNPDRHAKNKIFPIINQGDDPKEQLRKIENKTRFVNQHIRTLAKKIKINPEISFIWARHTFATNAIRKGASLEFVSEAMSHTSTRTTQVYFAGFEDEKKQEIAKKLFEF